MEDFENNDRKKLKKEIMSLNFAINDLVLYLDTHPNCLRAINLHNEYSEKIQKLIKRYQELYGPLTVNFTSNNTDTWAWSKGSWPWERSEF